MKAKMKTWTARNTTEEVRLLDREAKSRDPKVSRSELVRELLSPWFAVQNLPWRPPVPMGKTAPRHKKEKKKENGPVVEGA